MHWFLGDTWHHEIKQRIFDLSDVPLLAHMFMMTTPGSADWPFIFTNSLPICSGRENSFPAWNLAAASSLCLKHESPELSNKPIYTSRHDHCPSNHSVLFNVKPIICRFCLYSSFPPSFLPLFVLPVPSGCFAKQRKTSGGCWDVKQRQKISLNPQEWLFTINFRSFWEISQGTSPKNVWQEQLVP